MQQLCCPDNLKAAGRLSFKTTGFLIAAGGRRMTAFERSEFDGKYLPMADSSHAPLAQLGLTALQPAHEDRDL